MNQRGLFSRAGAGVILALVATVPAVPVAQTPPLERARELIAGAMQADRLPSLSVAVARRGDVVFVESFGLADVENSVASTTRSVYRIGSVSKTLTAVAALKLAEEGVLDLDAPVQQYCEAYPSTESRITPGRLLTHQGGIRDYDYSRFQQEFLSKVRYDTLDDAVSIFKDDPLVAEPATQYRYTSFGYVLLGCAIEGATGVDYEEVLTRTLLDPAGMTQTTVDRPERLVPFRARGYGKRGDGSWTNAVYVDLSDRFPAGGLLSTPRDLVAFVNALFAGKLLDRASVERMWAARSTADGEVTEYGLGWRVSDDGNEVYHGGTSVGGSAYLYVRPADETVVSFVTNLELWTRPRHELARQLADVFSP